MFFVLELMKNLLVTPPFLGKNLETHLFDILQASVEGNFNERFGYILKVTDIKNVGEGRVKDGSGDVLFPVSYQAIVFMPYRGEVLEAQVVQAMEIGFLASVGPMSLFVTKDNIAEEYVFEMHAAPSRWVNKEDPSKVIQPDTDVRVKIIGITVTGGEMYGVCVMSDAFLGPIQVNNALYN